VSSNRTQVALADDDVLLREGLSSLLERSGFDVVAQAGNAAQLIAAVRDQHPDLVIVDIRMPPDHSTEGLDAARVIRAEFPQIAVLVLSAHAEVEHAMDLLASGQRSGYLLKDRVTDVDEFLETLRRLVRGASVVDPALVHELVAASRVDDPLAALSTREREVLALMAEGRSNAGIARCLWVTEGTVEKHVRSILMKLHLPETGDDHRRVLAVLAFLEARLPARLVPGPVPQQPVHSRRGQLPLGQERDSRAGREQVGQVLFRVRRDHDDLHGQGRVFGGQQAGQVEPAFRTQLHVDQGDVRAGLPGLAHRLGRARGYRDHREAPGLQRLARDLEETRVVVDQQAAYGHAVRLARAQPASIAASCNISGAVARGQALVQAGTTG
jgi:DNA-binding NarL/FixJ family response regulator